MRDVYSSVVNFGTAIGEADDSIVSKLLSQMKIKLTSKCKIFPSFIKSKSDSSLRRDIRALYGVLEGRPCYRNGIVRKCTVYYFHSNNNYFHYVP